MKSQLLLWLRFSRSLPLLVVLGGVLSFGAVLSGRASAEPVTPDAADAPTSAEQASAAADDEAAKEKRIEALEKQLETIAGELEGMKTAEAVPEEKPLRSFYGLGPAASKVYWKDRGLSIGGYGDIRLRTQVGPDAAPDQTIFDALRAVLYVGYKFTDRIVLNSEFEFEHATSGATVTNGGGTVSVEFLTLDFLLHDLVNLRGGLLLIPMGFLNEMHEPTTYFGAARPEVERAIIPTTWRENGAGGFGGVGDMFTWKIYGVAGFNAQGFSSSGLRGGRQKGSISLANDWGFVARGDLEPIPGLLVGVSVYTGNSGQKQSTDIGPVPDALTTIYELHAQYRRHGLSIRGLFSQAFVSDAGELSYVLGLGVDESVASRMVGGYAEAGYDLLPLFFKNTRMSFEPFFRYEYLDTQDQVAQGYARDLTKKYNLYTVGANFKPHPQVVLKFDYRMFDPAAGTRANEIQASMGFAF